MEISNTTFQTENQQVQASENNPSFTKLSSHEFMKLSIEERRRILVQQTETMSKHYQQDKEWQELQTGDLIDY